MSSHVSEDPRTDAYLNRMLKAIRTLHPHGATAGDLVQQAVGDVSTATEDRRMRVQDSAQTLPPPLWAVLLIGAVLSVGFSLFFGLKSFVAQLLMVSILAVLIALSLFVILTLDLPFTGGVAAEPTAMKDEINEFCSYNFVNPGRGSNCHAGFRTA
jgi:hypothetical protein